MIRPRLQEGFPLQSYMILSLLAITSN